MELTYAMIDLETLGLLPSTKIVAIGAILFDPRINKVGDKFYTCLDVKSQAGRTKDQSTIDWWKRQSAEVREQLKGTAKLEEQLDELAFWLPANCKVMGNGAGFDITILEDAYRQYDIEIPWKFWNVLDMRTVKAIYEDARGGLEKKSGGTLHNALDDAYYQAKNTSKMWMTLTGRR